VFFASYKTAVAVVPNHMKTGSPYVVKIRLDGRKLLLFLV